MSDHERTPVNIGIAGIRGRMGGAVAAQVEADPAYRLVGGIVRPGSAVDETHPLRLEASPEALLGDIDVLIDVSLPHATAGIANTCASHGTPLVCGVTGLDDDAMRALRDASERIPVWYARNLSHGISVLLGLLPALAAELVGYDVSIVERHHRQKRDAPSGTALALARAITGDDAVGGGGPVDIQSVRAGGITGEHDVTFTNAFEEIRIGHRALDRAAFAAGAVRATRTIAHAAPGWYGPE